MTPSLNEYDEKEIIEERELPSGGHIAEIDIDGARFYHIARNDRTRVNSVLLPVSDAPPLAEFVGRDDE